MAKKKKRRTDNWVGCQQGDCSFRPEVMSDRREDSSSQGAGREVGETGLGRGRGWSARNHGDITRGIKILLTTTTTTEIVFSTFPCVK